MAEDNELNLGILDDIDLTAELGATQPDSPNETTQAVMAPDTQSPSVNFSDDGILSITRSDFSKFTGILDVLQKSCGDADMIGGKIRQKSDDRQAIFYSDLSSILPGANITLSLLRKKVPLLKSFELDGSITVSDESIRIAQEPNCVIFSDALSKMNFRRPIRNLMDNKFMDDGEFHENILRNIVDENHIFTTTISSYLCKRIRALCDGFETESITCEMTDQNGQISVAKSNKEESSVVIPRVPLSRSFPGVVSFPMNALPFKMELQSDVQFSLYTCNRADAFLCALKQRYFGIPIDVYIRVSFETR